MRLNRIMRTPQASGRSGFTLVELLVVISIIALLISILMPSLSKAREQARSVVCATRIKGVLSGMSIYATENKDYIAGSPSTSGSVLYGEASANPAGLKERYPYNPAQVWDWGGGMARSMNMQLSTKPWADRFNEIRGMKAFSCPSSNKFKTEAYDPAQWDAGVGPIISYNTSRNFMWPAKLSLMIKQFPDPAGMRPMDPMWGTKGIGWKWVRADQEPWAEKPNGSYIPRVDKVGAPAGKVYLADGSRYSGTGANEQPDYDGNPFALYGGAFSDSGPYTAKYSRSWSRAAAGAAQDPSMVQDPRIYSYRHGKREPFLPLGNYKMNVGFFDNHVDTMNDIASANPHLWLPRGFSLQKKEGDVDADVIEKFFTDQDDFIKIR